MNLKQWKHEIVRRWTAFLLIGGVWFLFPFATMEASVERAANMVSLEPIELTVHQRIREIGVVNLKTYFEKEIPALKSRRLDYVWVKVQASGVRANLQFRINKKRTGVAQEIKPHSNGKYFFHFNGQSDRLEKELRSIDVVVSGDAWVESVGVKVQ